MSYLSNFTHSKDNNFNLIRIFAALAVLVTHSFALSTGHPEDEPFRDILGMTIGSIAVDIFFIASGFLVTGSILRTKSSLDFVVSRFLRIYPALLVTVFLTVLILGVFFTQNSLADYFQSKKIYAYIGKTSTLIFGVEFELPGVFHDNPFPNSVNGSLWTMPYEIKMYCALLLTWIVSSSFKNGSISKFRYIVISFALISGVAVLSQILFGLEKNNLIRLAFMFFSGASFYLLKEKIKLKINIFLFLILTTAICALIDKNLFSVIYYLSIPYLLFFLAFIPGGNN